MLGGRCPGRIGNHEIHTGAFADEAMSHPWDMLRAKPGSGTKAWLQHRRRASGKTAGMDGDGLATDGNGGRNGWDGLAVTGTGSQRTGTGPEWTGLASDEPARGCNTRHRGGTGAWSSASE